MRFYIHTFVCVCVSMSICGFVVVVKGAFSRAHHQTIDRETEFALNRMLCASQRKEVLCSAHSRNNHYQIKPEDDL